MAVEIVKAMKVCSSDGPKQSLLSMLKRVSKMDEPSRQKVAALELKHGFAFLRTLEAHGFSDLTSPAEDAIFGSTMEHLDSIVRASCTKDIGLLAGLFIDKPAVLKRIADTVVASPSFVGPTLKYLMSLVPEPASNEIIVGLATARAQQLLSNTRNGLPAFSWCQIFPCLHQ
jgi:hypothetical protein